jgi:hypothetical protein
MDEYARPCQEKVHAREDHPDQDPHRFVMVSARGEYERGDKEYKETEGKERVIPIIKQISQ